MALSSEIVWNMYKNQPRKLYAFIHECMNASVGIEGRGTDDNDYYGEYRKVVEEGMMRAYAHCVEPFDTSLAAQVGAFIAMYEPAAIIRTIDHMSGEDILDYIGMECSYTQMLVEDEDFEHFENCFGEITRRYFGE